MKLVISFDECGINYFKDSIEVINNKITDFINSKFPTGYFELDGPIILVYKEIHIRFKFTD